MNIAAPNRSMSSVNDKTQHRLTCYYFTNALLPAPPLPSPAAVSAGPAGAGGAAVAGVRDAVGTGQVSEERCHAIDNAVFKSTI